MKLTLNKIASELCKREGKKSQAKIHDMREALRCLVDWSAEVYGLDLPRNELDLCPIYALWTMVEKKARKKVRR